MNRYEAFSLSVGDMLAEVPSHIKRWPREAINHYGFQVLQAARSVMQLLDSAAACSDTVTEEHHELLYKCASFVKYMLGATLNTTAASWFGQPCSDAEFEDSISVVDGLMGRFSRNYMPVILDLRASLEDARQLQVKLMRNDPSQEISCRARAVAQ
eukprot:EC793624.1.p1 GENE.EC793624.1~~EC793624.1.p1  ORF type:complete len:156 (+),score=13.91 EC793624.1:98-565(+)